MGVYIPDIDIPAPGEVFYFVQDRETGEVLIQVGSTDKELKVILVPPHGRLGDLDELLFKLPAPIEDEYKHVRRIVVGAPTIIPADKGG